LSRPSSIITSSGVSIINFFPDFGNPRSLRLWLAYIVEQVIKVIEITVSTFMLSQFSTFKIFKVIEHIIKVIHRPHHGLLLSSRI